MLNQATQFPNHETNKQITLAPLAALTITYGTRSPTFGAVAASL